MFKTRFISMLVLLLMTATGAWATITVTWNNDDITGSGNSFTKDGVTITAGMINFVLKDFYQGGTFTTTLGNFTKIEVTADDVYDVSGTGWSGSDTKKTWTGNASSVPFSGAIYGNGAGNTKFVFTIEPATVAVTGVTLAPTSATLTLGETETVTLIPTVLPGDATDKSVTWSSSNEAVATVTDGVVTAVAAGEATITVTTTDGAKTATCAVTVAAPAASTYTVTLKEGTDDATNWTITPAEATTTGVAAGTEVKATYGGTKKVKSVKAVKKAKPAATVTTAPTAKTGVKAGQNEAIVNAGTAEGGTMMYMVNATQPASTDGFSATVPTAEGLTAGTYYVWYYVKADDSHTDSEISASGIEVTIEAAAPATITVTWNNNDITDSGSDSFTKDGVTITAGDIDFDEKSFLMGGTFTTTLGNFTKIEITAGEYFHSGDGWSGRTWTGNASSVSFSGDINMISSIVFTIEPTN